MNIPLDNRRYFRMVQSAYGRDSRASCSVAWMRLEVRDMIDKMMPVYACTFRWLLRPASGEKSKRNQFTSSYQERRGTPIGVVWGGMMIEKSDE